MENQKSLSDVLGRPTVTPNQGGESEPQHTPVYREVDITQFAKKEEVAPRYEPLDEFLSEVDAYALNLKVEADEIRQKDAEDEVVQQRENELNEELGLTPEVSYTEQDEESEEVDEDELSLEEMADLHLDDMDEETEQKDPEENLAVLKSKLKERLKPFCKKVDLASMTVSSKKTSVHDTIFNAAVESTGEWLLSDTGIPVTMKRLPAYLIDKLQVANSPNNKTSFNSIKQSYKILYDQIVDANKPKFEDWIKSISFKDEDDLFFTAYIATFKDSNTLAYECTEAKCDEIFVKDADIMSMYKCEDTEHEAIVNGILDTNRTLFKATELAAERIQISDEYVIDFVDASIYSAVFEPLSLPENIREKYSDQIGIMAYIGNIYYIDHINNELQPIEWTEYPNDVAKHTLSKYREFCKVLRKLDSTQSFNIDGIIASISKTSTKKIQYIYPEATCPKCGKVISETVQTGKSLLFLRHNLSAIANI